MSLNKKNSTDAVLIFSGIILKHELIRSRPATWLTNYHWILGPQSSLYRQTWHRKLLNAINVGKLYSGLVEYAHRDTFKFCWCFLTTCDGGKLWIWLTRLCQLVDCNRCIVVCPLSTHTNSLSYTHASVYCSVPSVCCVCAHDKNVNKKTGEKKNRMMKKE